MLLWTNQAALPPLVQLRRVRSPLSKPSVNSTALKFPVTFRFPVMAVENGLSEEVTSPVQLLNRKLKSGDALKETVVLAAKSPEVPGMTATPPALLTVVTWTVPPPPLPTVTLKTVDGVKA